MKTNITTNQIEEVLLKRATEDLLKELNKARRTIASILDGLRLDSHLPDEAYDPLVKWVSTICQPTLSRHSGGVTLYNLDWDIPEEVKKALLRKAIPEFLKQSHEAHSVMQELLHTEHMENIEL